MNTTPRTGRPHTVTDRYKENPYRCSPIRMRQTWSGMARPGQHVTFTSILLPHAPSFHPAELVSPGADPNTPRRIWVAVDRDDLCAIKVIHQPDALGKRRYETWVMINDTGKPAEAGPLRSDGLVAVIGHDHKGRVRHRVVVGGQVLAYRGQDESVKARKVEAGALGMPKGLGAPGDSPGAN